MKPRLSHALLWPILLLAGSAAAAPAETFLRLKGKPAPSDFDQLWGGFDARAEPLETEVLHEWEEEDVVLRIVRFRVGVFKGKTARLAAIYGYPKGASELPGLVQIHGGGQYADYQACLLNAKRGYATISIAWAGRISAPGYRVGPTEVKLFWDGQIANPRYKPTTDWGAVDGYHAPGRNPKNSFPSIAPAAWTLDQIESPRNSGWFLAAVAARRALTFLERQPQVDKDKLGVYGHSMGGKLTVLTAPDPRVKAAAPSCGGISDRDNHSELFRTTLGDDVSLKRISCPIIFLSPANDFHGRIGDLPKAIHEIKSRQWRVTCAPHHNHQDTAPYEVATLLWFDQHLRGGVKTPATPKGNLTLEAADGTPSFTVTPDASRPIVDVDVYYTQQGRPNESGADHENTKHRFWRRAKTRMANGVWRAKLPVSTTEQPLWAYANITYKLDSPISGAGYYYRRYNATTFNVSSVLQTVTPQQLRQTGVSATLKPTTLIESFADGWRKEWFSYRPAEWARTTNKLYDDQYKSPPNAKLVLDVQVAEANKLIVQLDDHAAEIPLAGGSQWRTVALSPSDFANLAEETMNDWKSVRQLSLSSTARLRPARGDQRPSRVIGGEWNGPAPNFRNLRWQAE